jgi:hypothetical protein
MGAVWICELRICELLTGAAVRGACVFVILSLLLESTRYCTGTAGAATIASAGASCPVTPSVRIT